MSSPGYKISTLVFIRDIEGRLLLIKRGKSPNKDLWSPIGGKLEMDSGESPFECAIRETREEIELELTEKDLHLFAVISEKSYEGGSHWLMFLFDCKKRIKTLPERMSEGEFGLFFRADIGKLSIPDTDRTTIWKYWDEFSEGGQVVARADCSASKLVFKEEQIIRRMDSQNEKILDIFRSTGALLEGHFILRSGLHSAKFFQCARVCEHMDRVSELVSMLLKKISGIKFDTVLSPAMGGLVLGQETARQSGARFIFAEKSDGKLELRRNFKVAKGEKFLIVEDVITRGGRVSECIDIIKKEGGIPVAAAVLVDRSDGAARFEIPHVSLLDFSFPTYPADSIPEELAAIPAVHPGS